MKKSLLEKAELLSKLDEELIDHIDVEELDNEIEQVDYVKEKIEYALLDIDLALESSERVNDDEMRRSSLEESQSETTTTTTTLTTVPTSSAPIVSATGIAPITTSHPVTTPAVVTAATYTPSPGFTPQVKLPKLSLKRFAGDSTQWMTFWDSFNSSVHSNPVLSDIDRFNYLNSFLESTAAESIAGLTPTSANYREAVDTLQRRFGDPQVIISRHMDALLNLNTVTSHHDHKGLRRLYDTVESHVRGLRSLKVPVGSYGSLLASLLLNRLPSEIRIIVTRELSGEESWNIEKMLKIIDREIDARERSMTGANSYQHSMTGANSYQKRVPHKGTPTTATFLTDNPSSGPSCVYCGKSHQSSSCTTLSSVDGRKEALRKSGRCYICLRKYHISRNCRSSHNCTRCRGRHHVSICSHSTPTNDTPRSQGTTPVSSESTTQRSGNSDKTTNTMCVDSQTPVLLQTAKLRLYSSQENPSPIYVESRAILDSGSQRSYVTRKLKETLRLPVDHTETLCIRTFGSTEGRLEECEVVEMKLLTDDNEILKFSAVVVPFICNPLTSQPINQSGGHYDHLVGLKLADAANLDDALEIDVLIGSDFYWKLVTGKIARGWTGPTAIQTKVGWILSGPAQSQHTSVNLTLNSTHALRIESYPAEKDLDDRLRRFWELESLGVSDDESPVHDKFVQSISFNGERYTVSLPWREGHPSLPDHFELCYKRLLGLFKRLKQDPQLLRNYHSVIKDQISNGVVEIVDDPSTRTDRTHHLPHHAVVRHDKTTTKLRVVYDASARVNGPSLNDCLHVGPKFGQSIFDILLRFRFHRVALAGDIEKAFLMVAVKKEDRDSLRFLWSLDPEDEEPKIITLRFARVAFGVSSSPFLLNATIKHHMERYRDCDPLFVDKFLSSIYVDDVSLGANDIDTTYELYLKSKTRLAEAGFKLRKFVTNSVDLRHQIQLNEQLTPVSNHDHTADHAHREDDQSYAKDTLGTKAEQVQKGHKILGIQWHVDRDVLNFDMGDVSQLMTQVEPTKRNVVSMSAKFYDPLGIVSPVTILFKMFFQQLCKAKVDWDDPLTGELVEKWMELCTAVRGSEALIVPRCYFDRVEDPLKTTQIVGFCDASTKAYAAVVYLRLETEFHVYVRFLCAKTRVVPLINITVPRLELLSALLLSRLIVSVKNALELEVTLGDPVCYTDSKVALCWIQGENKPWKQFVQNRVVTIRSLVPAERWKHCPGKLNPADIPSRGTSALELKKNNLWLNGPDWLKTPQDSAGDTDSDYQIPEECQQEMRRQNPGHTLTVTQIDGPHIGNLMDCGHFSSFNRLLGVTALVIRFVHVLRSKVKESRNQALGDTPTMLDHVNQARLLWIRESQSRLPENPKFQQWKRQLNLFLDKSQVWRCGGRMGNSDLPSSARTPTLLDKTHHLAELIIMEAHRRVQHGGVKSTLTELRSTYWLVRGRQIVRKLVNSCVTCRRLEGRPFSGIPPPPLPEYRVRQSRPFSCTGVDFAGPLYVKTPETPGRAKTWLCLYTCCSTRAVHLDLVPNLSATAFLRSFKRFTARRGIPSLMVSDNAKTFKTASRFVQEVLESPEVIQDFIRLQIKWKFNLERAPWWGGIFERMIKSAKRCIKKTVGKSSLTYDELLTVITEVEAVLNSRPISYVSMDDLEEPLTPSHLLTGFRVLSLPDPPITEDPDYNESPNALTRRMRHFLITLEKFWKRWKAEYLLELREFHRVQQPGQNNGSTVKEGEIVTVFDETHPRGLWRLGKVESVLRSSDGGVRGALIRTQNKSGSSSILRRPIQHLYPLDVRLPTPEPISATTSNGIGERSKSTQDSRESRLDQPRRSRRQAAIQARDRILGFSMMDEVHV